MIFRTINADAKKLTEQLGLLNKSFRDIKKDFANGLGFKNSLFQTSISKSDYQALQKFNSAIKVTNDGLTKSQRITKAWNENMTGCSIAAKRMGNDLVTGKKNIQDISKAMNTASGSTKALGVAMNVMANVGFMLVITAITKVITELAQAQENAIQAAKEATETYKSEINSIADYKQRLSELHEELKSGSLSYEETKTKRTELMTIQDELIEKFGTEKSAIESVTDAVNGQVDALDNLNEKAYRDWVAKADEQTFWNKLLPGGKSGLDQAIDYMETEKTVSFMDMQNANLSDELQAIQKEIDETIRAKYNLDKTFAMFNVTGTPDELRTQLENIRQDYIDISKKIFDEKNIPDHGMWKEYQKETIDSINKAITSLDKGLEKHQDTYRTYIEGLIKYDSEYSDEYANILQKRAELESAQNSGNEEEIKKAKKEFMDSINDAIIASDSDESIKKYFESLYPELQAEFDNWAFEFDLEANVKGLGDIAKEIGEKYTATDLLNMVNTEDVQEGEESFNSLIDKAIEYGVCTDKSAEEVQKLIDLLVELGIIQDDVKGDTFNDKNPISFTNAISQVESLSEGLDQLDKIYADVYDKGDFDWSSILNNEDFEKTFGKMEDAYDDFIETVSNSPNNIAVCQSAFDNLATEYIYNSGALDNLTESTKEAAIAMLEQMGIANADEIVTAKITQNLLAAKVATIDFATATNEDINALVEYANQLGFTAADVATLCLEQIDVSNNPIQTQASLANLQSLIQMAGVTGEKLSYLLRIINAVNNVASLAASGKATQSQITGAGRLIENLQNQMKDLSKTTVSPKINYTGGSATDSAKRSSDSSSKETKETAETLNWIDKKLESAAAITEKLSKAFDKAFGMNATREKYKDYIAQIESEINDNITAAKFYQDKLQQIGLSYEWIAKIQFGDFSIDDITDENLKKQISEYQTYADKLSSCFDTLESLEEQRLQAAVNYAEKVIESHEKEIESINRLIDRRKALVSLKETFNGSASEKDLSYQQKQYEKQLKILEKQNQELYDLMCTTTYGDEAWQKYNEAMMENADTIKDLTQSIADLAVEMANIPIEKYEKFLDKMSKKNDLYSAKIDNAVGAKAQNNLIDKQIDIAKSEDKKAQDTAKTTAKNVDKSINDIGNAKDTDYNSEKIMTGELGPVKQVRKKLDDYYKEVNKYTKSKKKIPASLISKIVDDGYANLATACSNYNANLGANETAQETAKLSKEETQQEIATLTKQQFDNISDQYDRDIYEKEQKQNKVNNAIALKQEKGQDANVKDYKSLIKNEKEKQKINSEKAATLQKELDAALADGSIKKGSEEWYAMIDMIDEATNAAAESEKTIVEFTNAMRQLKWDAFDDALATVKRINSEADYYIEMMSHKKLVDEESGEFTEYGTATLGLHNENYKSYISQANQYLKEYNELQKQIANGELSADDENVIQRSRELQDNYRDAKLAAEDELQAIQSLVKEGYEVQLDSLKKIIDKYKELKNSALDAYKYQKQIEEKIKNIASLQKQLSAHGTNDSEESRATIQKLKVELQDAKDDLKDTQYEKYLSDTEEMLDDLYSDYTEFIDEKMSTTDGLLDDIKELLGNNGSIISTLMGIDKNLTDELRELLGGKTTSEEYADNTVSEEKNEADGKSKDSDTDKNTFVNASSSGRESSSGTNTISSDSRTEKLKEQLDKEIKKLNSLKTKLNDVKAQYNAGKSSIKNKDELKRLEAEYNSRKSQLEEDIRQQNKKIEELNAQIAFFSNLKGLKGYKNGSDHINKDQLAFTQENGTELIYRKSDGAMLTPLGTGDMVFTNEMAQRLWNYAQSTPLPLDVPFGSSGNIFDQIPTLSSPQSFSGNTTIEIGDIVMNGVNDAETFGRQLREEICRNGKTTQCIAEAVSSKQLGRGIGSARRYQ